MFKKPIRPFLPPPTFVSGSHGALFRATARPLAPGTVPRGWRVGSRPLQLTWLGRRYLRLCPSSLLLFDPFFFAFRAGCLFSPRLGRIAFQTCCRQYGFGLEKPFVFPIHSAMTSLFDCLPMYLFLRRQVAPHNYGRPGSPGVRLAKISLSGPQRIIVVEGNPFVPAPLPVPFSASFSPSPFFRRSGSIRDRSDGGLMIVFYLFAHLSILSTPSTPQPQLSLPVTVRLTSCGGIATIRSRYILKPPSRACFGSRRARPPERTVSSPSVGRVSPLPWCPRLAGSLPPPNPTFFQGPTFGVRSVRRVLPPKTQQFSSSSLRCGFLLLLFFRSPRRCPAVVGRTSVLFRSASFFSRVWLQRPKYILILFFFEKALLSTRVSRLRRFVLAVV